MSEGQKTALLWLMAIVLLAVCVWITVLLAPPPFTAYVSDGLEPSSSENVVGELIGHLGKTNLNTADTEELLRLPHMTDELARRISTERDNRLPVGFTELSELLSVDGVTEAMLEAWKEQLYCG